jgi:hypothetical protein
VTKLEAPIRFRYSSVHLLILIGVIAVVYFPLFFGEVIVYRDMSRWVFPTYSFIQQAWQSGDLPFWNPRHALGFSVGGSPLHGLFYLPSYLVYFIPPAFSVTWLYFLHLIAGAIGMWHLARCFKLSPNASLVSALAWALSGVICSAWTGGVLLAASAWFPLIAVGFVSLLNPTSHGRDGNTASVWFGLWARLIKVVLPITLSILLGEIFQTTMAIAFGLSLALIKRWQIVSTEKILPFKVVVLRSLAALVWAIGLSAVLWLPMLLALTNTERGGALSADVAEKWSLHPLRVLELLAPGALGDPFGFYPGGTWAGDGSTDARPLYYSIHLGTTVFALLLAGLNKWSRENRRLASVPWLLMGLAVLGFIVALGRHTPVHGVLRTLVPIFAYQRFPEKFVHLFTAFATLAAGFGFDSITRMGIRPWRRWVGLLLCLLILVGLGVAFSASPIMHAIGKASRTSVLWILGLLGWLLLRNYSRSERMIKLLAPLAMAVVILDLVSMSMPLLHYNEPSVLSHPPRLASAILNDTHSLAPPRVFRHPGVQYEVNRYFDLGDIQALDRLQTLAMRPATFTAHGLTYVPGYDVGVSGEFNKFWDAGEPKALQLFMLLGIGHVVMPVKGTTPHPTLPGMSLMGVDPQTPGVALYRMDQTLPRVFWVGQSQIVPPSQQIRSVFDSDVVGGRKVHLLPNPSARSIPANGSTGECHFTEYRNVHLAAICSASGEGYAVFLEQFAPGWKATLDGQPVPILKANVIVRAVFLGAGTHRLTMDYELPGLTTAIWIVSISLLLLILTGVLAWWWRKQRAIASQG